MNRPDTSELAQLVRDIARRELLPRFAAVERQNKADGSIVTVADHTMQQALHDELARRWPGFAFLGEEMSADEQAYLMRTHEGGLWIVDPLDGTSNFTAGIPFFSVSVALMIDAQLVLGIVYDPSRDECFSASLGQGASLNGAPLRGADAPDSIARSIAAVDFKRLQPALAQRFAAAPPYSSQRSFGSVALDWCWVAASRFHVYLHGKQKVWDYAAGLLILNEVGGYSCALDGQTVFAPSGEPRSAIASRHQHLFEEWRDWILAG